MHCLRIIEAIRVGFYLDNDTRGNFGRCLAPYAKLRASEDEGTRQQ